MMNSLYTAATGMSAMQSNVDVIANNLANVNTTAFKGSRLTFEDLLYQQLGDRQSARNGAQTGMGVAPGRTQLSFVQGDMRDSDTATHMAIEGNGFFQVALPDGTIGYSRDGSFEMDANGQIVTKTGYQLEPSMAVPMEADPGSLKINRDGFVSCQINGATTTIGQIEIATFANPNGLAAMGSNVYAATVNSGAPAVANPGTGATGILAQGKLEGSNVSVMTEMVDMINAQRAFESVSKVISTSDEMLGLANSMRR
ncbi:MAG: flagellar basal-body rod protein FlgG [Thermoleophilia bacterium]|nr:flagellar basal-body rod protein FlgG [Thermoleophilia bacterium]MCZ4495706.1 flagellar basal-body rod protein FlgG [Thermoleophilia bacterium]